MTLIPAQLATPVESFVTAGVLTGADLVLAERLISLCGADHDPDVLLGAALALRAPRFGHVCVELARVADRVALEPQPHSGNDDTPANDISDLPWPDPATWQATLAASPAVRGGGQGETPLVLEDGRLYLDRYWHYEQQLAQALIARAAQRVEDVDLAALRTALDELFGPADPDVLDRQRLAAALAVLRRLTVIAGGPGTGKTYTVTRVLALLHAEALAREPDRPLRVALAAPTGKAAARLQDSLRDGLAELTLDPAVRDALERTPAFTLHRLLGTRRDSGTRFRHSAGDPLPHDVIIVDEASMVSLPMMAKLIDAVRDDARLVLLGDRDQLASVEAGAAFGDICGPHGSRPVLCLSSAAVAELEEALGTRVGPDEVAVEPGVWDAIVRLDRFRRYEESSPLGTVAAAIQREDTEPGVALRLLQDGQSAGGDAVRLLDPGHADDALRTCETDVVEAYAAYVRLALGDEPDPAEVLAALGSLRVLCALRRGPQGAWAWNERIEARLAREVAGFRTEQTWYVGRPILITRNDYGVRLYNGDVGVILADPDHADRRIAVFPATDGTLRRLSPARLPACETTFAMTIHKSQGSQFDHAVVILPEVSSPVLTRELVYTAITRATKRTTLLARESILREAIGRPIQRATGLLPRLWDT